MLILFLLQILWSKTAGSAALTNSNIDEGGLKQERIYKSQGEEDLKAMTSTERCQPMEMR